MEYQYLIGIIMMGAVWALFYFARPDLQRPMVWSGLAYIALIVLIYILWKFCSLFYYFGEPIVPGYWSPRTLFGLGQLTGGYGLEDLFFSFFSGGIATCVYEYFFKKKIRLKKIYKHHFRAPLIGIAAGGLFALVFQVNLIYPLIVMGFAGAASIWWERKDLIYHSVLGGLAFFILYFVVFLIFNYLFSDFISSYYKLENLTGIMIAGVPLEELLFALSLGVLWAPIYEYEHGEKN